MQLIHLPKKFPAPIANGGYSECCRCITSTTLCVHNEEVLDALTRKNQFKFLNAYKML